MFTMSDEEGITAREPFTTDSPSTVEVSVDENGEPFVTDPEALTPTGETALLDHVREVRKTHNGDADEVYGIADEVYGIADVYTDRIEFTLSDQ